MASGENGNGPLIPIAAILRRARPVRRPGTALARSHQELGGLLLGRLIVMAAMQSGWPGHGKHQQIKEVPCHKTFIQLS
jgi:hypothetical protein